MKPDVRAAFHVIALMRRSMALDAKQAVSLTAAGLRVSAAAPQGARAANRELECPVPFWCGAAR